MSIPSGGSFAEGPVSDPESMEVHMGYHLVKVYGLWRSGNHAIINWLLGLQPEKTLFFNDRRVGRSLLDRPSGISMPPGINAHAIRENGKGRVQDHLVDAFRHDGERLVVSFENFDLELHEEAIVNRPIIDLFGEPETSTNLIILRNPFSVMPSLVRSRMLSGRPAGPSGGISAMFGRNLHRVRRVAADPRRIWRKLRSQWAPGNKPQADVRTAVGRIMRLWPGYARRARGAAPLGPGRTIGVVYDFWVADKSYRDRLAQDMGLVNLDRFLDFVSDAGGGSSFEGTAVSGDRLRGADMLRRWEECPERAELLDVCREFPDIIAEAKLIFGDHKVPDDARRLAG